jgi:hypothetical protein
LGVALHDLKNPAKIVGVSDSWILQPEDPWEITGYVHNVVFTCGAVLESDGTVKIYWGGADTVMCVGEADVSDLVALCLDHSRPAIYSISPNTALLASKNRRRPAVQKQFESGYGTLQADEPF